MLRFANVHPSALPPSLCWGSVGTWNPAAQLCLALRRQWHQPASSQYTVRAFSNHTVFTGNYHFTWWLVTAAMLVFSHAGKSLHSLPHPYLPLSVVMRQSNTT